MKKKDVLSTSFWIALSLFIMPLAYKYDLGEFHNPGPGLFPFLLGAALFLVAGYFLLRSLAEGGVPSHTRRTDRPQVTGKILFVSATLFGYAVTLEKAGYFVSTVLLLALLLGVMQPRRWKFVIIASIVTALITYFGFMSLGVRFPAGILRLR
jgi:putative tricarboxylic transport membrane protein